MMGNELEKRGQLFFFSGGYKRKSSSPSLIFSSPDCKTGAELTQ